MRLSAVLAPLTQALSPCGLLETCKVSTASWIPSYSLGSRVFSALLGWKRSTVEHNEGLDVVHAEHADALDGVLDERDCLLALDEVLGAPEGSLVKPDVGVDGKPARRVS